VKARLVQYGAVFLGVEAWVALRGPTSGVSLVIGWLSVAVLAWYFVRRVRREIRGIKEDNRQAREAREAGRSAGREVSAADRTKKGPRPV
jgi:uncharacterized membrane protein YfcA